RQVGQGRGSAARGLGPDDLQLAAAGADRPCEPAGGTDAAVGRAGRGAAAHRRAGDGAGDPSPGGGDPQRGGAPKRRFAAITLIAAEGLPVEGACSVLGVSVPVYYVSRSRPPSQRSIRHAWLTDLSREIHAASY